MEFKFFLKSFSFLFHVLKTLKQPSHIHCVGVSIMWAVTVLIFLQSQLLPRSSRGKSTGG